MFSKAKHPERVFVGSVQQLATDIEEACWRPGKPTHCCHAQYSQSKDGLLLQGHYITTLLAGSLICIVYTSHTWCHLSSMRYRAI